MNTQKLIMHSKPSSPIAEAFRTFRTNLNYTRIGGDSKSLLFTSTLPGEGKSLMIANSAVALAQAGAKVILVDCDLRKPMQSKLFGKNSKGLTNYLCGQSSLKEIVQPTEIPNLSIVVSGPTPPNPSELLVTTDMEKALNHFQREADYLLIDSPPILPVTDACVLSAKVDGVIFVLGAGKVRPTLAQRAKESLEKANAAILGVLVSGIDVSEDREGYYHYYGNEKE